MTEATREAGEDGGQDDSAISNADDSQPFFSQPESHTPASPTQVHGPAPKPSEPMESTPRRTSSSVFVDALERPLSSDASAQTQRSTSGPFAKLSELRPSALRRTVSRPEATNLMEQASNRNPPASSSKTSEAANGAFTAGITADTQAPEQPWSSNPASQSGSDSESESETESDTSTSDSSSDSDGDAASRPTLPASKMAGANATASEDNASSAKRKRTFFSALSE